MSDNIEHPKICDLCGKDISEEDIYYIGVTRYNILAFTCTGYDCKKWLIHWRRMTRVPGEEHGEIRSRSGGQVF